jgi:hypothetical protein
MTRAPRWLKPINTIYVVLLRRGVSFGAEHLLVLTCEQANTVGP